MEATNQIWAPFSVSFWCHFLILFLPWFPHRVFFGFGGFVVVPFWVHSSDSGLLLGTILLSFSDR